MLSTIAVFSSSRRRGNTGQLIDRIAMELNIEVVDLAAQRLSPFDYDHSNTGDDFEPLMQRVLAHDQITPVEGKKWIRRVHIDRRRTVGRIHGRVPRHLRLSRHALWRAGAREL